MAQPDSTFEVVVAQEEAHLRLVHPTPGDIPGCMALFDTFLSCNVLASQLKSLYRHGHISRCSDKLDDFKFCLSTRTMHPDERREAWIRRRAEWWARRRLARSSEGVWEVRREPLENYPPPLPVREPLLPGATTIG